MKREKKTENSEHRIPATFRIGVIAMAFLFTGYQAGLFVQRAARLKIEAGRDNPDTVFVVEDETARRVLEGSAVGKGVTAPQTSFRTSGNNVYVRSEAAHSEIVETVRESSRKVESFTFDPNTVPLQDLQRLGFSQKQAQSIINYREKGGRFRRKSDFAESFVVADSVYRRLEPFIDIPLVDINKADSAAFDALPGIGGYFARKMVEQRERLGGYSCTEQLMDIYHFDRQKYDALKDLICCSPPPSPFRLWTLDAGQLRHHPYIRNYSTARAIVLYRENNPRELWSVPLLRDAGILDSLSAARLDRCVIEDAPDKQ